MRPLHKLKYTVGDVDFLSSKEQRRVNQSLKSNNPVRRKLALEHLIMSYLPAVFAVDLNAHVVQLDNEQERDLEAALVLALVEAANNYDPDIFPGFGPYLHTCLTHTVKKFRDNLERVHVEYSTRSLFARLRTLIREYSNNVEGMAKALETDTNTIYSLLVRMPKYALLDDAVLRGYTLTYKDVLIDRTVPDPMDILVAARTNERIEQLLTTPTVRGVPALVFKLRTGFGNYGADTNQPLTYLQIKEVVGLSVTTLRKLYHRVCRELRRDPVLQELK